MNGQCKSSMELHYTYKGVHDTMQWGCDVMQCNVAFIWADFFNSTLRHITKVVYTK